MNASSTAIVAKNTTYQFVAKAITMILSMVALAIIARFLSVDQYGEFTLITTIFVLTVGFTDLKIEQVAVREISADEKLYTHLISQSTFVKFFFSLLIVIISSIFILFSPYSEIVKLGAGIALLGVLFNGAQSGFYSTIQYALKAYLLTFAEVIAKVVVTILVALVFWLGLHALISPTQSLYAFSFISTALPAAVIFVCFWHWATRQMGLKMEWRLDLLTMRWLLRQSWPLWIMGFLFLIHYRADMLILSFFKSSYDVGIYGLAYRFLDVSVTLPPLFIASIYPILSKYAATDPGKAMNVLKKSFNFILLFVVILAIGLFYGSSQVVALFGGAGHEDSAIVLQILSLAVVGSYLSSIIVPYLIAIRAQKLAVWTLAASVLVNLGLSFWLIPQYSYYGAAIATATSELLGFGFLAYIVKRRFGFSFEFSVILKIAIIAVLTSAVLWLTGLNKLASTNPLIAGWQLVLIALVGGGVYGVLVWRFKIIDQDVLEQSVSMLPLPDKLKKLIHG